SDGLDPVATASTPNQRAIIDKQPAAQPYPGDTIAAAPVDGSYSQSISRSSIQPVKVQALPPVAETPPTAARQVKTAATQKLTITPSGTVARANTRKLPGKAAAAEVAIEDGAPKGRSRAGGTLFTVRDGETVYNLSRRYGVPANTIMK